VKDDQRLSLVEPLSSLTVNPSSLLDFAVTASVVTDTMLLATFPISVVLFAIRPYKNTMALLLVIDVCAFVNATILPGEDSLTMHLAVDPSTFENTFISPVVLTVPSHFVFDKVAFIAGFIVPLEKPMAILEPVLETACKDITIWPRFNSFPRLLVILPFPVVLNAVLVHVDAFAVALVLLPITNVSFPFVRG